MAADGAAALRKGEALLFSSLNANITARGISMNQKTLGDLTATAKTKGREVDFQLTSDIARSNIRGTGRMAPRRRLSAERAVEFQQPDLLRAGPAVEFQCRHVRRLRGRAGHCLRSPQPQPGPPGRFPDRQTRSPLRARFDGPQAARQLRAAQRRAHRRRLWSVR